MNEGQPLSPLLFSPQDDVHNHFHNLFHNKEINNRAFSHDVTAAVLVFQNNETAAVLVFQNNETAAILVYQDNPVGVEFFSYANAFFFFNKFA